MGWVTGRAAGLLHRAIDSIRLAVVVLLLAVAPGHGIARVQDGSEDVLTLAEVWSLDVPPDFPIVGAALSSDGAVVAWGAEGGAVLYHPNPDTGDVQPRIVESGAGRIVAARIEGGRITVVDGKPPRVIRFTPDGRILMMAPFVAVSRVDAAVWHNDTWALLGRDVAGDGGVFRASLASGSPRNDRLSLVTPIDIAQLPVTWLVAAGPALIVAGLRAPFRARAIGRNGALRFEFEVSFPVPGIRDAAAAADSTRWVALRPVRVGRKYLRTFADVKSDRRVLAVYDEGGRLLRQRVLEVPLGLIAAVESRHQVLAARNLGSVELVAYEWYDPDVEEMDR